MNGDVRVRTLPYCEMIVHPDCQLLQGQVASLYHRQGTSDEQLYQDLPAGVLLMERPYSYSPAGELAPNAVIMRQAIKLDLEDVPDLDFDKLLAVWRQAHEQVGRFGLFVIEHDFESQRATIVYAKQLIE